MIALLFLGIIPGTNFQINFTDWLLATAAFGAIVLLYVVHKKKLTISRLFRSGGDNSNGLTATQA